jgi:hypothetical protein
VEDKGNFVRDAEDKHGKEREVHCVDIHVDDEIKCEGESEIVLRNSRKM